MTEFTEIEKDILLTAFAFGLKHNITDMRLAVDYTILVLAERPISDKDVVTVYILQEAFEKFKEL